MTREWRRAAPFLTNPENPRDGGHCAPFHIHAPEAAVIYAGWQGVHAYRAAEAAWRIWAGFQSTA